MNRRFFLRNSSLAGITLPAAGLLSFKNMEKSATEYINDKDNFILNETTISFLQEQMQNGKLTSVSITEMYLQRISDIDKKGPALNAVIEINPDALSVAATLDKERKQGKTRSALHGIPVLIKDNIGTADKMMTTAGSLALLNHHANEDAFIITSLRQAGAVILGKTNLSEWANFRSTSSTSGWSGRGRQTKCPYILDRNPSGSSSGSGAAAAANLCTVAIGTETDGSVVSPSAVNGLVGIKPTVGLLSRSGIIPISATQDTAGAMARTVRDAAILLGALTGIDERDKVTKESLGKSFTDYTQFLQKDALKGKRIGVEKSHLKGNENIVSLLKQAIRQMTDAGAVVVEVDLLKNYHDITDAEFKMLQYEFKDGLNKYLAAANAPVKSLKDVIDFNKQHEAEEMPYFKQEILLSSEEKTDLNTQEYKDLLAKSLSSKTIISELLEQNKLDALCGVTNGLACCIDLVNGDYDTGFSFSAPAATAGFPHITVPMGFINNLPLGISFFSAAYTEPLLISLAYAYEQITNHRQAPAFKQDLLT